MAAPARKRPSACSAPPPAGEGKRQRLRVPQQGALQGALAGVSAGLAASGGYAAQLSTLTATARELMNAWDLWIAGRQHRIAELEAYVHGPAHADPYTHGDEGQLSCGAWYFHRQGGSYKSGTFKGLDLASGDRAAGVHAGLLVRSVLDSATGELVEGPCLVVDRILRLNGAASIADFAAGRGAADLPAAGTEGLLLRKAEIEGEKQVWSGTRVGLVLRDEKSDESSGPSTHSSGKPSEFCTRPYRFSTVPERLSKFRSGFAVVAHLAGTAAVPSRFGIPQQHYDRYIAAAEKARKSGDPAPWVDRKIGTQPELCELIGACHSVLKALP